MKKKVIFTLIFAILYSVIMLMVFPFALIETIIDFIYRFFEKMIFDLRENYISNIKYLIEKLKKF